MSREKIVMIRENIEKALVCRSEIIELVIAAVLSRGHVLIEDVPGIGKTTLVRSRPPQLGVPFSASSSLPT